MTRTTIFRLLLPLGALLLLALGFYFFVPRTAVLSVGQSIPEWRLKDLEGNDFFFNETRGKVLVLNFWATWCTYCREELPFLDDLAGEYEPQGLRVVSVLKDVNNFDLAREFRDERGLTLPILMDGKNELFKAFGVGGLPFSALIDRTGRIRYVHLGFDARDAGKYRAEIRALLEESEQ